ncbi:MAG: RNA polymerase sigma factor [Acidimicrobiales bacterium]
MVPEAHAADADLLTRAAARHPAAVRALLDATAPVVYGFVFARVGGDEGAAEDLVQETYLEAVRSAATFRGEAALSTWLCAIARRRLARHYEAERRRAQVVSGLVPVEAAAHEDGSAVERRDEIVRALGRLPASQRQVLVAKYLDDRTVDQIATELGRTAVQVQSLLQRGREGLRRQLEPGRD